MRVLFGRGTRKQTAVEAESLATGSAMVLAAPDVAAGAEIAQALNDKLACLWSDIVMHVPIETAQAAREKFKECKASCIIAVGGGSAIGLGKAIALTCDAPLLAVPTTYAGSEMTPIWGITEQGRKVTGRDHKVLPRTVIYDADLVDSLPASMASVSGVNALAHCAEALYAPDANPLVSMIAAEGIRLLGSSLPNLQDKDAREKAQHGCWLAGLALGSVSMSLHHKLCHALGGTCALPHAQTHAVVLPHALAYNFAAAPDAMATIAQALNCSDAALGVYELNRKIEAPASLAELGMQQEAIGDIVAQAVSNPYANPAPLEKAGLTELLENAYAGKPPVQA